MFAVNDSTRRSGLAFETCFHQSNSWTEKLDCRLWGRVAWVLPSWMILVNMSYFCVAGQWQSVES